MSSEKRTGVALWPRIIAWLQSFNKQSPEVEFYPAALEIIETPASPAGRTIAWSIILFFLLAVVWASFGSVDIIATAQGRIVPQGRTKVVQPLEQGVIRAIHVQEGQQVKAGETLIEIDSTINEAERDRLQKELIAAQLDVARLKAALNLSDDSTAVFIAPEGASQQQTETQRSLLRNQVEEIRSKLAAIDRQITQNQANRVAVEATISKLVKAIPLLTERAKVRKYLSDEGYGSKLDTLSTQQELVEHEQELQVQKSRLAEATAAVAALREQRKQAEAEYRHETINRLSETEQKATSLQEQLVQAAQKYRLQTLTAPVNGTVQQLAVHTEGGVVTPAQALLVVVPADSHLEIEAMVSNRDIGFVHEDQEAEIKVDTFNFTKYGLLHGKVKSVSQDAITRDISHVPPKQQSGAENETSEPKGQELVYLAHVTLDQTHMVVEDRLVDLSPGMAVTVEIKTGTRRVIEYLLSPLFRYKQQALRER